MPALEHKINTRILLNNVLYATDFSTASHQALPYALAICRYYESTLHAIHVLPEFDAWVQAEAVNPVTLESARRTQSRAVIEKMRELSPELESTPNHIYVRRGNIWDVVSKVIEEQHVDLLVLGTRGREGIGKMLIGSVAEEMLRQCPCPVLTVGPKAWGRVKEEFDNTDKDIRPVEIELRNIIFATDFSPESDTALPIAISLAEEFQAKLVLLHVFRNEASAPIQLATERLERLVPEEASLWCRPETVVRFGAADEKILQTAAKFDSDLIVLGIHSAKDHLVATTHFPWSVAHKVIANAQCPVLTMAGGTDVLRAKPR
jgi:nucleotide-binding universal stress UspA family protein